VPLILWGIWLEIVTAAACIGTAGSSRASSPPSA